jgi:hypothetical protein
VHVENMGCSFSSILFHVTKHGDFHLVMQSSIHDKDNTYTWQNAKDVFIAQLNSSSFGGYSDWRMPTVKELSWLVNSDIPYPGSTIDATWFPHTVSSHYWSSTTDASNTYGAWLLYFGYGSVYSSGKSYSYYVRAVRGGQ